MVSRRKTRGTATDNIVNMSGIFKPHEECSQPRTVLIEGKPGMGKTTYCKKLVYDWASGYQQDDCFPKFEAVLFLKCRDMQSDLWKAIDDQLLPREVEEDVRDRFFKFICQNQSHVLLVLDGLDEVPTSKLPVFTEIIQGRVLPKCRLVATARHEAGIKVRIHSDTLLEIEGFTEEDARKFIFKYFKTSEELAQKLFSKLRSDKNLKDMAANPLNTALLCLVCEEYRGVFPERRTELYVEIIQCILRRYRRKKGLSEMNKDLIEVYESALKHLGRIALHGLLQDKLDFEESELQSHADYFPGFGFLSVQTGGSKLRLSRHYSFLHKSFQEWFAALYLYYRLIEKEISPDQLLAEKRFALELKEVLLYTCGLLAARCKEEAGALMKCIMREVVSNDSDDSYDWLPVVLEFVRECKQDNSSFQADLVRELGSSLQLKTLRRRKGKINAANAVILADVLKSNTTVTKLDLSRNTVKIDDASVASLAEMLKSNTTLTKLNLSSADFGTAGAASLAEALKSNTTLTKLNLSVNTIYDAGVAALAEALKSNTTLTELELGLVCIRASGAAGLAEALKSNTSLTKLDFSVNDIGADGAAGLAEALKSNTTLTNLNLADTSIGAAGAAGLAEALKSNTTLTELDCSGNHIGAASAAGLAEVLKSNTTLTELDFSGNDIGAAGAADLAEVLKSNTTLTVLSMSHNGIGAAGAASLAEALKSNTTLTELDFSGNDIGAAGAADLAEVLKSNTTLTVLSMPHNGIGAAGAAGLGEALKSNTTLTVLNISNNSIGAAGAAGLAEALKSNTTLTELDFSRNDIGDAGAAGLTEAVKFNSTLTKLDLSLNRIGDAGAAGLAEALKSNTMLAVLNVSFNNIGDAGAAGLAEALKSNTTLTLMKMYDNGIGGAGAVGLAEALKFNTTLTELDLSQSDW